MQKNETDFYIGWQDKAPPTPTYAQSVRWLVGLLFIGVPLVAGLLVWYQRGFSSGIFEYGQLTKLEGELILKPVPVLRIPLPNTSSNQPLFEQVLLIGHGKHGAGSTIRRWEAQYGPLIGKNVKIKGTLLYHAGHAALELIEKADGLLSLPLPAQPWPKLVRQSLGTVSLQGEIVDPKCFLGVMKPGEGRPHRSCAIRCIAGGIPPVLWVSNDNGHQQGYLLVGPRGESMNTQLLDKVGRGVRVTGRLEQADNWMMLYVDRPVEIVEALPRVSQLDTHLGMAICH